MQASISLPGLGATLSGIALGALLAFAIVKFCLATLLRIHVSGRPLWQRIAASLGLLLVAILGGAFAVFAFAILTVVFAGIADLGLDEVATSRANNPLSPVSVVAIFVAPALFALVLGCMTVRLFLLRRRRTGPEWGDWFPLDSREALHARVILSILKVELSVMVIAALLITTGVFVVVFTPTATNRTLREAFNSVWVEAPAFTGALILAGLVALIAISSPQLMLINDAFRALGRADRARASKVEIDVNLRGSRWRSSRHRVCFGTARSLQRCSTGFRSRLTSEQYDFVARTCSQLSNSLRRLGASVPHSREDDVAYRHMRAAIAIIVRDDTLSACAHASDLLGLSDEPIVRPVNRLQRIGDKIAETIQRYWPAGKIGIFIVAALILVFTGQIEKIAEVVFK